VGDSHLNVEVLSTAIHEVADEHDTDSKGVPGSTMSRDDHVPTP
jgi:hypothetical protein